MQLPDEIPMLIRMTQRYNSEEDDTQALSEGDTLAPPSIVQPLPDPQSFEQSVLSSPRPTVVIFSANWSQQSRALAPTYATLARHFQERIDFLKVDAEASPDLAQSVRALPTVRCYWHGRVVAEVVGQCPAAEIERLLRSHARRGQSLRERMRDFFRLNAQSAQGV